MNTLSYIKYKISKLSTDQYKSINEVENTCGHCKETTTQKMKQCVNCGERNVCKSCYYEGDTSCVGCKNELKKRYNKIISSPKRICCEYCDNKKCLKSKKCDDCKERKICSDCYYNKEIPLCKSCSHDYEQKFLKLENELNQKKIRNGLYEIIEEVVL